MKKFFLIMIFSIFPIFFFTSCDDGGSTKTDDDTVINDLEPDETPDKDTVTTGFTAHYYSSYSDTYIHFNDGTGWTTVPGKKMTSEGDGWFVYTHNEWYNSVEFVFNDGGDTWDNNNDENYKTALKEFWVKNGEIYDTKPSTEEPDSDFIDEDIIPDEDELIDEDNIDEDTVDEDMVDNEPVDNDVDTVETLSWNGKTATVSYTGDTLRTYTLSTDNVLRDNYPSSKQISYTEQESDMILRSGSTMFDALFAMALKEVRENSVESITDWSFNSNNPVSCSCFETGAEWHYVWTRDTSYAVNLGLAIVDPTRARNSLEFKISEKKSVVGGGDLEIVQDTGSGGSWPVSTDRVVWSLGAMELLKYLDGTEKTAFLDKSYEAMVNTIENDRKIIYDSTDGLYKGEQSFLDWREQTYPYWTADDTVNIAMSKTLSTNVLHYIILKSAAELATEKGFPSVAEKYQDWADDLKTAINTHFWRSDVSLYSAMKTTYLDDYSVKKYDLLGEALAVISGVADDTKAAAILANYPILEAGPAVIWPQEPKTRIYHNRAIWPFVTAYALKAAQKAGNDVFMSNAFYSLVRGAALNLSNMENYEFSTLSSYYTDNNTDYAGRALSGPVVDSRRQLWSVGGYISLVLDGIFGRETTLDGIQFSPKIPVSIRNNFFGSSEEIVIKNIPYKSKKITVKLELPVAGSSTEGFYVPNIVTLNGNNKAGYITASELNNNSENVIVINFKNITDSGTATLKTCSNSADCYAPLTPSITSVIVSGGKMNVMFDAGGNSGVTYNIFRNGALAAANVTSTTWADPNSSDYASKSYCYSVSAVNTSGNESHHAKPVCFWGSNYDRVENVFAQSFDQAYTSSDHGRPHFADWGKPEETLSASFTPLKTGLYYMQTEYGNGRAIDTGITSCLKYITITDTSNSSVVGEGYVVMPHLGANNWDRWGNSSFLPVSLEASKTYKVEISDEHNMSYFDHFNLYTGGDGGGSDVNNKVNLSTFKFLYIGSK